MRIVKQRMEIAKEIRASSSAKEWKQDPKGYFLIRLNKMDRQIEVAFCTNDHVCKKTIVGTNAQDIYYTLIREKLVSSLQHAAYLGKELQKAEMCLKENKAFVQD